MGTRAGHWFLLEIVFDVTKHSIEQRGWLVRDLRALADALAKSPLGATIALRLGPHSEVRIDGEIVYPRDRLSAPPLEARVDHHDEIVRLEKKIDKLTEVSAAEWEKLDVRIAALAAARTPETTETAAAGPHQGEGFARPTTQTLDTGGRRADPAAESTGESARAERGLCGDGSRERAVEAPNGCKPDSETVDVGGSAATPSTPQPGEAQTAEARARALYDRWQASTYGDGETLRSMMAEAFRSADSAARDDQRNVTGLRCIQVADEYMTSEGFRGSELKRRMLAILFEPESAEIRARGTA